MDKEILKINLIAIAGSGLLMLMAGLFLYLLRGWIQSYLRFFLPIPPLGVAAYVFVFNMLKDYNGSLPPERWKIVSEVLYSTLISAIIFGVFTVCLVLGIYCLKKYI
jgi:predicted secreted protein